MKNRFDMIYNRQMFANEEFLYAHIFENMKLNNRGEEFRTTVVLADKNKTFWDIVEGLKMVKGIDVKSNSFNSRTASIEYQYDIPRTDKISTNRIIILFEFDESQLRGNRCCTLIVDGSMEYAKGINDEIWKTRINLMMTQGKDGNYTDAAILIY